VISSCADKIEVAKDAINSTTDEVDIILKTKLLNMLKDNTCRDTDRAKAFIGQIDHELNSFQQIVALNHLGAILEFAKTIEHKDQNLLNTIAQIDKFTQDLSISLVQIQKLTQELNSAIESNQGEKEFIAKQQTSHGIREGQKTPQNASESVLEQNPTVYTQNAVNATIDALTPQIDTFILDTSYYNDFGTPIKWFNGTNNPCGNDAGMIRDSEANASGCHSTVANDDRGIVWLPDYFLRPMPTWAKDLVISITAHEFQHAYISKVCHQNFPPRNEEVTDALTVLRYGTNIIASYDYDSLDIDIAQNILQGKCEW
jgi:hypothetical protein